MIGDIIHSYRKQLNMTQEELALRANIGKEFVEKMEQNMYQANTHTIFSICSILDIPISTITDHLKKVD